MSYLVQKKPGQHLFNKINYLQIELHTGCFRQYHFCGILHSRKAHTMSLKMYTKILKDLNQNTKIILRIIL